MNVYQYEGEGYLTAMIVNPYSGEYIPTYLDENNLSAVCVK
jgi:hypothetical protein